MINCRVCDSRINSKVYKVQEMHFGTGDEFEYQQCSYCGCLQIVDIPENLSQFYPKEYYSKHVKKQYRHNSILSKLRGIRLDIALGKRKATNIFAFFPKPHLPTWVNYLNVTSQTKILDVGCGAGASLLRLRKKGFLYLEGVDPLIDASISYPSGVTVHKKDFKSLADDVEKQNYDLIMLHHSLEHIPDQHEVFISALKLLNKQGKLLISIPLSSSWAWEHYRENWVQLDAPRHLYLHSMKSIKFIAEKHGFKLSSANFDSSEFQFIGSERYVRNISLQKDDDELFSYEEIENFKCKSKKLNDESFGDQACFIFSRLK